MLRAALTHIILSILVTGTSIIIGTSAVRAQSAAETQALIDQATQIYNEDNFADALPLFQRLLLIVERKVGKNHPETASCLNYLAIIEHRLGHDADAEPLYKRAIEIDERSLGKDDPKTLTSVSNLAVFYDDEGRYKQSEPLHRRALEGRTRVLGRDHPDTLNSLQHFAVFYFLQQDWAHAADLWRRSTGAFVARAQRRALTKDQYHDNETVGQKGNTQFDHLVKAVYRLPLDAEAREQAAREMFLAAQWALRSDTERSLALAAARNARSDPILAALIRERQDREWRAYVEEGNTPWTQKAVQHNVKRGAASDRGLEEIDARMASIDKELKASFPDYARLAYPVPLTIEEVQALLKPDEALVLILDTFKITPAPEESFIWAVTKSGMRWVHSDVGVNGLDREQGALRCGLSPYAWSVFECPELTGQAYSQDDRIAHRRFRFDHARAFRLYKALFGEIEEVIKGKHLLIVAGEPLAHLPLQVLITAPPANEDNRTAAWIIRDHALSMLPAVSSLRALRQISRRSQAAKPIIGFGNPLLDGDMADPIDGRRAALARVTERCPESPSELQALRALPPVPTHELMDVAFLKEQSPLPETAYELCEAARLLRAKPDDIHLGSRATEREVKRLSASGELAQYRIVHFATHGVLAEMLSRTSEPGLILTPPDKGSKEDDGYLTASEIGKLKLDADWVILSACSTSAGQTNEAASLSGLARAFFYAGTRGVLASYWSVDSDASVKLVTSAIRSLATDKDMGPAEAMRRSALRLIDEGPEGDADPLKWAPFMVIGEGSGS